ncbi:alpha-1,6-mannosylglycoprotein 6-beta-N-acetylglucosaminyltransferase A-like isoform X2 [Betta splendens]|uniref:alpha-1,6-mannosyl-glycoprotein 6-beta-N-acetylglucosaminyltransferase n=1 Tax=Betta splendens TaxID=158456 RepID=A0A6P7LF86_BETSP|nr:alpha-1,6-mannosylglycoprotein 6-beta-N-acetylglucosaminyltransferase A-like isoform X2 [Betta splendens]
MRKLKRPLQGIVYVLLGVGFIWCLTYFILSNTDEGGKTVTSHDGVRPHGSVKADASRSEDIMKFIAKFADDLLNIVASSDDFSAPSPLKDYKGEWRVLQIKLEAEEEKAQMRDTMIKELRSDKLHLQEQVVHLEELLKLKAGEDAQSDDQDNCPLPPMDGHPECIGKLKWMKEMWESDSCYRSYGVNGSQCSFLIYLSEIESWCPVLQGRTASSPVEENSEEVSDQAVIQRSLKGLYSSMENRTQFRWIQGRILSMEKIWFKAGQSLSAKYNLTERKAKQILVHPGAVTDESGFRIAQSAFSGGPLGELVQWSDLISTLYILGHRLHLSASVPELKHLLGLSTDVCPPRQSAVKVDLIYTDIIGLKQIQSALDTSWTQYKCMIRVLDSFGTEPDFNHAAWAEEHYLKSPFGGLNLIPMQFYTMFPHTPDNTFLGFVVQHQLSSQETQRLESVKKRNRALVYGKSAAFWEGKRSYLDTIHKHLEIHGTVDDSAQIPEYVVNHGIVKGTEVQTLLRQSKVFVGLSFPYEGPAPLEALANGCVFLNPRLDPPLNSLNSQFFSEKPTMRELTSQHPYAEAIGEPYVWMVDMYNLTDVERALTGILNQNIEPYVPYEFTSEGMLQRVNVLIEKQDFCYAGRRWPPRSALQVVKAEAGTSCKQACQDAGLICEPAFFPDLNSVMSLADYGLNCHTSQYSESSVVLPAYDQQKHCLLQADHLLFSCVRSDALLNRVCPCRDYIKDQRALCTACV